MSRTANKKGPGGNDRDLKTKREKATKRDAGRPVAGRPDFRPVPAAWDSFLRDPVGLFGAVQDFAPVVRTPRLDSSSDRLPWNAP